MHTLASRDNSGGLELRPRCLFLVYLGAGLLVGVFGREMEDLPEETEETEERGVDCLLILGRNVVY